LFDAKEKPRDFKKLFKIGEKEYSLGLGGLHSKSEKFQATDMVDLDMGTFYTYIALKFNYYSGKLSNKQIIIDTLKRRESYKKASKDKQLSAEEREKATNLSNIEKEVLHTISFGALGEEFSRLYDLKPFYHITLTGQFLLLK
jgi:hypothetical protein